MEERWTIDVNYRHPSGRVERVRQASPIDTRRGAEEYERQVRQALQNGTFGKEKHGEERVTLAKFAPRFLVYSENNNKHSSVVSKRQILEDHIIPFFGAMGLDAIGSAEIEDFKAAMRKKKSAARARKEAPTMAAIRKRRDVEAKLLSLKTINNTLTVLSKLLTVAEEQRVIKQAPRVKLFAKLPKPTFDFLSFEEAERLVEAADPEWRPVIVCELKSGLRQGELIGLQWADVDLQRGKVQVRRAVWRGVTSLPKGGRERTVDLPSSAVEVLRAHRHLRGPYVFCQADGQPLTAGLMEAPLQRALRQADICREQGRIGWHDLRHTYASHLAMRGVPLKAIQELMGHATIEMTERYAHLSPETRASVVQQLDQPVPLTHAVPVTSAGAAH